MLPFRGKGIISLLILLPYHTPVLVFCFTSELRVCFLWECSEKGLIYRSWTLEICILNHTLTKNITQVWDTSAEYQTSCLQRVWYSADVSQTSVIFFVRVWFNIYHSFQPFTGSFLSFLSSKVMKIHLSLLLAHVIMCITCLDSCQTCLTDMRTLPANVL